MAHIWQTGRNLDIDRTTDSGFNVVGFPTLIQMTMRYAHSTPENKRKKVNILAEVFRKSSQKMIVDELNINNDNKDTFMQQI